MFIRSAFAASVAACSATLWRENTLSASEMRQDYELCFVQVVFRHGARTPIKVPHFAPVTSYKPTLLDHSPETFIKFKVLPLGSDSIVESPRLEKTGPLEGGCRPGALTRRGAEQMYQLGRYIRQRYVNEMSFLPRDADEMADAVYTRTTNVPRTIASARSLLAGLFSDEPTLPLAIYTAPREEEILAANFENCKLLRKLLTSWTSYGVASSENRAAEIRKVFELPADEKVDLVHLRDNLETEEGVSSSNLHDAIGSRLAEVIQKDVTEFVKHVYVGDNGTTLPVIVGQFLNMMLQNMEEIETTGKPRKLINLYSCHDVSLVPILLALDIEFSDWPVYASNIIIELYRKNVSGSWQYFVKVLYNGEEKCVCNSESVMCRLEDFVKCTNSTRVSDDVYYHLCNVTE